ncbi:MAG: hypothetical protein NC548_61475 [Lachnospiraceae bacterium]|nr:hypothetical protein [Lachnospiraceae bacterium]
MTEIELKIGHRTFWVSEKDMVLDNGSIAQLITQTYSVGWDEVYPQLSKKLYRDLKNLGFLYTNEELVEKCKKHYKYDGMTYYKFNIPAMVQAGYTERSTTDVS